jgi:hypothetical protein
VHRRLGSGLPSAAHALEGFPEFVPSTRRLPAPGHLFRRKMSPLL